MPLVWLVWANTWAKATIVFFLGYGLLGLWTFSVYDLLTLFDFVFTFENNFILVCFLQNLYFITILQISISYIHLFLNNSNLFS